jgi:hypothetical protein
LKSIVLVFLLSGAGAVAFASVVAHPNGPVKDVKSNKPLLTGAEIDAPVLTVLERSCQNCHSEKTEWPWYSYIAPASWLIESDVAQARVHMNLSHWDEYTAEKKEEILAQVGAVAQSGEMPPARYTAIHANAKLSAEERAQIYQWARAERRRSKSATISTSIGVDR